jgi:hypothetical protein
MTVPFAFANLSGNIALAKLDSNFNTPITIGNTSVLLGNTVTTLNNLTLANVTITSGTSNVTNVNVTNITVTNLTATLANVTTLNASSASITSANIGTLALTNSLSVPNGGTGQVTFPANSVLVGNGTGGIATVAPGNVGNVLTSIGGAWVSNVAMSGAAAGANTQVQYNNSGALAGSANLVFDGANLGLGVTPSGFGGGYKGFEVGNTVLMGSSSDGTGRVQNNAYYDGTVYKYKLTGYANQITLGGAGGIGFSVAPSGTAGNAITFTQAMTLDASGNLLVGGTLNNGYKTIITADAGGSVTNNLALHNSNNFSGTGTGSRLLFKLSNFQDSFENNKFASIEGLSLSAFNEDTALVFRTQSNGNRGNLPLERMRLENTGNLLVGTTSSSSSRFVAAADLNNQVAYILNVNTTVSGAVGGVYVNYTGASPNSTVFDFLRGADSTANRVSLRSNGGIANYQANDVNLSDRREKTNFAPAKSYLDVICAIPVQTFNYIDQSEYDPGLTLGVVAQDVQAVAPELISESNWGTADDPKIRLSIYQTDLQYALMKCIQEQQAIIQSLTDRVTQLETK